MMIFLILLSAIIGLVSYYFIIVKQATLAMEDEDDPIVMVDFSEGSKKVIPLRKSEVKWWESLSMKQKKLIHQHHEEQRKAGKIKLVRDENGNVIGMERVDDGELS